MLSVIMTARTRQCQLKVEFVFHVTELDWPRLPESGNMVIMALSYAQKTGDNSQLQKYVGKNILDILVLFLIHYHSLPCWINGHSSLLRTHWFQMISWVRTISRGHSRIKPTLLSRVSLVSKLWRRYGLYLAMELKAPIIVSVIFAPPISVLYWFEGHHL